jgi:molecular chaperone GrpE
MMYPEEHGRPAAADGERPAEPEEQLTAGDERPAASEEESAGAPVASSDEPATSRDDAAEPGGDEDPANEEQRLAEKEAVEREDPLARAQRERDEYLDLARRAQADFENYRKRAAKEAAAAGERAKSGLVRELLPVVDNLERALASAQEGEQHLAEGVRLVHSELIAVLERNGVEQFDPKGESFDPTVHEALSTRNEDGADPGVVLDVIEKGYKANGTVLRPARVVVSG